MASRFGLLAGLALALTFFWDASILTPVKLLVVLVHEMWHGISALIFGLQLDQIRLSWDESGETLVSGNISTSAFIVTVLLGYPGTAFTGAVLLRRGLLGEYERTGAAVFAGLLLYMTYLFTSVSDVGFIVGAGWACAIGLLSFHSIAARATMVASGVFFIFYSLFDLFDFQRDSLATDAGILANYLVNQSYSEMSVSSLATITAVFLSIIMIGLIYFILKPAIIHVLTVAEVPEFTHETEANPEVDLPDFQSVNPNMEEPIPSFDSNSVSEFPDSNEVESNQFSDFSETSMYEQEQEDPDDLDSPAPVFDNDRFYQFLVDPENAAKKLRE